MRKRILFFLFFIFTILAISPVVARFIEPVTFWLEAAAPRRANVYLKVVATNPSKKRAQQIEVKEYLPQEVVSEDMVVSTGGLELKYDTNNSLYYVYKKDVQLAANEIRTFSIELKDAWFVPEEELNSLKAQNQRMLSQIKGKDYETAKAILHEVNEKLENIAISQEKVRAGLIREQIADYRNNRQILGQLKEDVDKIRSIALAAAEGAGGTSGPEMLEKSKLKSGIPSKTATWMVVFIIMLFIGVLGAAFFFAWVHSGRSLEKSLAKARESAFPKSENNSKRK